MLIEKRLNDNFMKTFLVSLFTIFFLSYGIAQTDTAIGYIEYLYEIDNDSTTSGKNLDYTKFKLWFGKSSCFAGSESLADPRKTIMKNKKYVTPEDSLKDVKLVEMMNSSLKEIAQKKRYRSAANNIFITYEKSLSGRQFCVSDTVPKISWKLSDDTMTVSGLKCQKAEAFWLGRHFTVWYAPQIPVPFGPGNMGNLPGLIIEARDDRSERVYTLLKLETPVSPENKLIIQPACTGSNIIGRNELNRINGEERRDMMRNMKATGNN